MGAAAPEAPRLAGRTAYEQRLLLGLGAVLSSAVPLCLFFGTRGFAPVVGIAGLLCLPWTRPRREDWSGVAILAALVVWAAISVAWSPAPNLHTPHSLKALTRFTVLHLAMQLAFCTAFVTTLCRLEPRRAAKVLRWTALGVLIAEPLLIEEGLTGARLYQALPTLIHQPIRADWLPANLAQGGYIVAVLAWPLGIALIRERRLFLALILAATVPASMVLIRGVAPTLALAISLPCFMLVLRYGGRAVAALAALTGGCMLAMPFAMLAADHLQLYARLERHAPPSWSDRLHMWTFIAGQMRHAPLRGAGLDASRTFPGVIFLHPHNGTMQLWYELGAPGAALGILFWLWLWRRIGERAERDRLFAATASGALVVYLTIGSLSFGLWQEWWLCLGAFAMALCLLLGRAMTPSPGLSAPPSSLRR
jgi:O-antigen ligase